MDIITGFSADEELKKLVHKKKLLMEILLAFSVIYFVIDLFYWIPTLDTYNTGAYVRKNFFYNHRFLPIESLIRLSVIIICDIIGLKGAKLQVAGVENKDSVSFNRGVRLVNINLFILVLLSAIGILHVIYRTF